jgi:hypothetical protein
VLASTITRTRGRAMTRDRWRHIRKPAPPRREGSLLQAEVDGTIVPSRLAAVPAPPLPREIFGALGAGPSPDEFESAMLLALLPPASHSLN